MFVSVHEDLMVIVVIAEWCDDLRAVGSSSPGDMKSTGVLVIARLENFRRAMMECEKAYKNL